MSEINDPEPKKPRKTIGRPFTKGQSGNPGGRPKAVKEVIELARSHSSEAIKSLAEIATNGTTESARVAAANSLLDRAWGKSKDTVSLEGEQSGPLQVIIRRSAND